MDGLTNSMVITWLTAYADVLEEKKGELNELDREIGDGDHGENMARGFQAVEKKIAEMNDSDIGTILKTTAMTLISTVGGASGPLYGSFFLKAAVSAGSNKVLNPVQIQALLSAGFESVLARGKATLGDKTMIDAMQPALDAFDAHLSEGLQSASKAAAAAAKRGSDDTVLIVAKKGRASYLGERSVGHRDPGSESTMLLFEEFSKIF